MDDEARGRRTQASFYAPKLKEAAGLAGLWHDEIHGEFRTFDWKLVPVPNSERFGDFICINSGLRAPWVYTKCSARFYISRDDKLDAQLQLVVTEKDNVYVLAWGRPPTDVTPLFSCSSVVQAAERPAADEASLGC